MIAFEEKVKEELKKQGLTLLQMEVETGIFHGTFSPCRSNKHCPSKTLIMALSYYLGMDAERLVEGTDVEEHWYDNTHKRTPMEGLK